MRDRVKQQFIAGESLEWKKCFELYPASDGWTLNYYFRGTGTGLELEATADGDDFILTATSEQTEALSAGTYYFQAFVSLDSERILVDSGEVKVLPSLVDENETYDGRSSIKIILDAIDALIAGKASLDQQEYTIEDRQLKRYPIPDLIKLRETYARLYAQEKRLENKKKGISPTKNWGAKFTRPR